MARMTRPGRLARSFIVVALLALGAATATAQPTTRTPADRAAGKAAVEALATRVVSAWRLGDLAPIRVAMGPRVRVHGLDFNDADCRRRFRRDRDVARRELRKLADCLGSLRFRLSDDPPEVIEPFEEMYSVFVDDGAQRLELAIFRIRGALRVTQIYLHQQ